MSSLEIFVAIWLTMFCIGFTLILLSFLFEAEWIFKTGQTLLWLWFGIIVVVVLLGIWSWALS